MIRILLHPDFKLTSTNGISRDAQSILNQIGEIENVDIKALDSTVYFSKISALRKIQESKFVFSLVRHFSKGHFPHTKSQRGDEYLLLPQVSSLGKNRIPRIIRIHDVFPISNPTWFHLRSIIKFRISIRSIGENDFLLFNSQSTKEAFYRVTKTNASGFVMPCLSVFASRELLIRCNHCFACKNIEGLSRDAFFLSVGTIEPRKNYRYLIREVLATEDLRLIIVGKYGWKQKFLKTQLDKGIERILWVKDCCDGALEKLYSNSLGFINASLNEGFDIPSMEACQTGASLILSDIPVHREIHGDHAIYFKTEPVSLTNALNAFTKTSRRNEANVRLHGGMNPATLAEVLKEIELSKK